ncbi:hypothetical protein GGR56DRAFT_363219 [Xylariaceae sp. FL0804]|nr:hypothetical protein GGR56DRAFT_363219 [Xylariaceae sp. FL0804]
MATDPLPARLAFLTDAAHLLAETSPQTSAHLMSQRNSMLFDNDIPQSEIQRQHVCGSCGHIMIPGRGDLLKIETKKDTRRRRGSQKHSARKESPSRRACQKRLDCGLCGRYTLVSLPPPAAIVRRRPKQPSQSLSAASIPPVAGPPPEPAKPSANASSKKRAKSRRQGLQALLEQSSSSRPRVDLGLSLADFMKK